MEWVGLVFLWAAHSPAPSTVHSTAPHKGWAGRRGKTLVQGGNALSGGAGVSLQDEGSKEWKHQTDPVLTVSLRLSCVCVQRKRKMSGKCKSTCTFPSSKFIQIQGMADEAGAGKNRSMLFVWLFSQCLHFFQSKSQITSGWIRIWREIFCLISWDFLD